MKRIFLSFLAIALSYGAFAQETPAPKDTIPMHQKTQNQNVFLMLEAKMYALKDGVKSELTEDTTLSNGTVVTTKGDVKKPDGSTVTLKNGQYVDNDGNIGEWKDQL
ncbi:MAG: DUF6799 domain-containing protein [Ginsengibacter sp.]